MVDCVEARCVLTNAMTHKSISTALTEFLKVWGVLTLVVVAGFVLAYQ